MVIKNESGLSNKTKNNYFVIIQHKTIESKQKQEGGGGGNALNKSFSKVILWVSFYPRINIGTSKSGSRGKTSGNELHLSSSNLDLLITCI